MCNFSFCIGPYSGGETVWKKRNEVSYAMSVHFSHIEGVCSMKPKIYGHENTARQTPFLFGGL